MIFIIIKKEPGYAVNHNKSLMELLDLYPVDEICPDC